MTVWKFGQLSALALLMLLILPPKARAAMIHPGGWHTETDLERIRARVAAGKEPWKSAWDALKNSAAGLDSTAHVQANVTNPYAIQSDGHTVYVLAIKWVASGDPAYARTAIRMLNAWSGTVQSVADEPLRNGVGSSQMAQGAEILAHGFHGSAGWAPADVSRCQSWFKAVVYPHVKDGAAANWGTSAMTGLMSMAVFCDDREMFDRAVAAYKNGFLVNGSLKNGCAGVTQYIDATGENAESGRDQAHSQGGVAHLVEVALTAWNQGVNLVAYHDSQGVLNYGMSGADRLLLGMEYLAKYNLGNDVAYHPFYEYCNNVTKYPDGISAQQRGNFSPVWEMAYSLFTRAGLSAPYCHQVILSAGDAPEKTNSDHPGLGTLTFRLPRPGSQKEHP